MRSWTFDLRQSELGLITSTHLMEEAMRTLPIAVAYLRAGSFMENWLGALDHIRAAGEMPFFYAPLERKFLLVAMRDIGLAGAKVLDENWTGERVLEVNGPEGGTGLNEVAAAFGRALRREVKAVQLPESAWQRVLETMGMPADRTGLYIEMVKSFQLGMDALWQSRGREISQPSDHQGVRTRIQVVTTSRLKPCPDAKHT
jgi:NAD(P)H dehydrogenase (quinone)